MADLTHVIAAARALVRAQCRMLDGWAEADGGVKKALWRDLHAKGDALRELLDALPSTTEPPVTERPAGWLR